MQFKFLTAILLVGASLAQVSLAQSNTDIDQKGIVGFLITQAKAVIVQFTNVMTETIYDALKDLDQLTDEVKSKARETIASMEERINNVIFDAKKQIQEIADKDSELGIDISACITTSEDQFRQLLEGFIDDEVQWVQEEIDSAFAIINKSIEIVTEALDEVQALPEGFLDCESEESSSLCIIGVIWETLKLSMKLSLEIDEQIYETTDYVTEMQITLELFAIIQEAEAKIEAAKIVAEVNQCAPEAIGR